MGRLALRGKRRATTSPWNVRSWSPPNSDHAPDSDSVSGEEALTQARVTLTKALAGQSGNSQVNRIKDAKAEQLLMEVSKAA